MLKQGETIIATKAEIKALLAFASKDKYRPCLVAVQFDPIAAFGRASDGESMLQIGAVGSNDGFLKASESWLVPRTVLEGALRMLGKGKEITVSATDVNGIAWEAPYGAFPPAHEIRMNTSDASQLDPIGIDTRLLARLSLAQAASDTPRYMRMRHTGALGPLWFQDGANVLAVVMPCKI